MTFSANPLVTAVEAPPIAEALSWLETDRFGPETPLIDVSQAVPGYNQDPGLAAHIAECAQIPGTAIYTDIEGKPNLRAALAAEMSGVYGGEVTASHILISAGCNQAFFLSLAGLAKAGDEVVMAAPWYFNHKMTADMLGIGVIPLPCRDEQAQIPDPDEAARLLTTKTKAIVLVSPNNPTGAIYPADVLDRFFQLAQANNIALIVDETYRDFLPSDYGRPHDLFQRPDWDGTLVHLYSFSKVFCMTGYRAGAIATGPAFIAEIAKLMDCLAICAPHISQRGALWGIEHLNGWRQEKRALMAERVAAFEAAIGNGGAGFEIASIGAYFAYLRHPFEGEPAATVAKRLAKTQNLLCLPGTMFGPGQDRMLRFAFANVESARMAEIVQRLGQL